MNLLPTMLLSVLAVVSLIGPTIGAIVPFSSWQHQRVDLGVTSIHFRYSGTGPPLMLVHGYPEHSLTWKTIGPILAQNYTVITPDLRGMGDSGLAENDLYDAESCADDLAGILSFLNITSTYVFGHDKGTGVTAALVAKYRTKGISFPRVGLSEYPLPGFGYEMFQSPTPTWNLYNNWQLGFFSVVDAATFFITGRERQMLAWYFFHASYSGTSAISNDDLDTYATQISKPGFLRSGLSLFSNANVALDAKFFNSTVGVDPFAMPVLFLGGEASFGSVPTVKALFGPIAKDLTVDVVPKAGHWIADENPVWVADRIAQFLTATPETVPSVDLGYLVNKVTLKTPPVF